MDIVECFEQNWQVVFMFLTAAVNMKWNICIEMKIGTHSGFNENKDHYVHMNCFRVFFGNCVRMEIVRGM